MSLINRKMQVMDSEERDDKGRFLPGKSGNPNGRPKFSITSIIKEILEEIPEGEKRRAVEIAARKYVDRVREGDPVAFRDLVDRFDGSPRQSIEVNGRIELPQVIGFYPKDYAENGSTTEDPAAHKE